MGFSLSGVFGFAECKACTLATVLAGLLGTGVPAAHLGLFILWVGYSCLLVLLGRRCGRKVPLVKVVSIKRAESRFKHGATQLDVDESDDVEDRRISGWPFKDNC